MSARLSSNHRSSLSVPVEITTAQLEGGDRYGWAYFSNYIRNSLRILCPCVYPTPPGTPTAKASQKLYAVLLLSCRTGFGERLDRKGRWVPKLAEASVDGSRVRCGRFGRFVRGNRIFQFAADLALIGSSRFRTKPRVASTFLGS